MLWLLEQQRSITPDNTKPYLYVVYDAVIHRAQCIIGRQTTRLASSGQAGIARGVTLG